MPEHWMTTFLLPIVLGFGGALVGGWLSRSNELAKTRSAATLQYKMQRYQELITRLNRLTFRRALERECASQGKTPPVQSNIDDVATAREAVLLVHVCAPKRLVDAAWACFDAITSEDGEASRSSGPLCELVGEIRADVGLDLAPFDRDAIERAEKRMVTSCCTSRL